METGISILCIDADHLLEELRERIPDRRSAELFGYVISFSDTIKVIVAGDSACVSCGMHTHHFEIIESKPGTYYLSAYGLDTTGNLVRMTRDHVIPRAHGGADCFMNLQPMCETCNNSKSDLIDVPAQRIFSLSSVLDCIDWAYPDSRTDVIRRVKQYVRMRSRGNVHMPDSFLEHELHKLIMDEGLHFSPDDLSFSLVPAYAINDLDHTGERILFPISPY